MKDGFDFTDPGFLGFMDTREGIISRVAKIINESRNEEIGTEEFRSACVSAGVDPDSFTPEDLERLKRKLK